jgi:predicted extracellular nuclease
VFTSFPSGRRDTSARRPLRAALTAAFVVLQQVAFVFPAAAQTPRPAADRAGAASRPAKTPAARTATASGGFGEPSAVSADLVISQVYGGAGCGTAGCSTYNNDYIEIFNRGAGAVTLTGKSVQYASNTGSFNQATALSGTLNPGQYYLVQQAGNSNGLNALPTPNATGTIAMSANNGKVIIASTTTALACGATAGTPAPCNATQLGQIIDLVGYGTATMFEGTAPAPALTTTTADFRAAGGCTDTDQNSSDFAAAAPSPRNTSSPLGSCGGDAAPAVTSTGPADGATGVPVNSDIQITFSEPVFTADDWFSISCATSGAHEAAEDAGPTTFTLNPETDFANDEVCTVTVFAGFVGDTDSTDPPEGMAADYVFSFTTASVTPTLSVGDVSQDEGSGGGTTAFGFTVTLSAPAGPGGVSFTASTADGTTNPANAGGDYVAFTDAAGSIAEGETSASVTVQVNADTTVEPDETFFVNIGGVTGATVADGQGLGTVVNDDFVITPIHDIQGNGDASPLAGQVVTTTGIVTLLRTGSNAGAGTANGYFLQSPNADADPNTSEGIFVFTSTAPTVAVGDEVNVTGTVQEFNGLTELTTITSTSVIDTGNTLPTAVTLDSTILDPTAAPTQPQLEKFESMRMTASSLTSAAPNDT